MKKNKTNNENNSVQKVHTPQEIKSEDAPLMVREEASFYGAEKKQGQCTLTDYYALPEDYRAELIDGVIYDMTAPNYRHQILLSELLLEIKNYIRTHGGTCIATTSPTDVQLDCDDKTMVQPDLTVLCDRGKYRDFGIFGAPDLVMEILSPSTRKKDTGLKVTKYGNAGVREYWIIDPEQAKVLVYDFSKEIYPVIYGFTDKIPVGIFDGKCVIDFNEIAEDLYTGEE